MNEIREKAIELRKKGKSLNEIVQILNMPKGTIYGWIKNVKYNLNRSEAAKKGWEKRKLKNPDIKILSKKTMSFNNTKRKGDISEAMILAALIKSGKNILQPFGDNLRYDMAIDEDNGKISRIQCKMGNLKNGAVYFQTSSSYSHRGYTKKNYIGEIEYFGVYCPQTNECYLIPIEVIGEKNSIALRYMPPKNGNKLNYIKEYKI